MGGVDGQFEEDIGYLTGQLVPLNMPEVADDDVYTRAYMCVCQSRLQSRTCMRAPQNNGTHTER